MKVSTDVETIDDILLDEAVKSDALTRNEIWTTLGESPDHPIARLIREADRNTHVWHVEGLWQPNAIVLVHSLEGEFKSVFAYQLSEALATGQPLLRKWNVPVPMRVGVFQTEMPEIMVGERLKAMYPERRIPCNLIPSDERLKADLRFSFTASEKFQVIHNWLMREGIDVLVWDTINNALASCGNPNTEEAAAQFYNRLESLPHKGALVVRHDGKPSKDSEHRQSNQRVRGSNLHVEIASAVIQMHRPDKRTNKAQLEIGKLRHDSVPEAMDCWFDAGTMRLTLLPPHVALLEGGPMTRDALNDQLLT